MKLKTLAITVALLAVLSGIVFFANRPAPQRSADPRLNQPLLQTGTIEKASKIKISDQAKSVELAKQPDGSWRVVSYYDFPADFQKLSEFVGNLTSAKIEQFVTAQPEKLARLEFKDTKLALLDASDKPVWEVTLGKNADAGGRFVRFDDEKKGYRAGLSLWLDAEPKNWADSTLIHVKPEDIAKVEVATTDGAPVVAKRAKKDDPFAASDAPAGQRVKNDRITSIVSSLTSLRFSETSDPSDPSVAAAKQHERTVKLTTFDGKTLTVALGRKPEQKIVKPPAAKSDGKSGPAALGKIADAAKADGKAEPANGGPAKVAEPEIETIPAGPVFAFITDSDAKAPVNAMMAKRAFQVYEYAFTGLPVKRADLFEPIPPPPTPPLASPAAPTAGAKTETKPAEGPKK
ncbi:hypothetical protein DB347_24270 [Opitutaceae bacterium EW11]|nr:hypothetical protein DB347_24270 [Opitutaceae bacterium EW11]